MAEKEKFKVQKLSGKTHALVAPDGAPWETSEKPTDLRSKATLCNRVLDYVKAQSTAVASDTMVTVEDLEEKGLACTNCVHRMVAPQMEDIGALCLVCGIGRMELPR